MGDAISAQSLVKKYKDFTAVDGISFDVKHGETFAILGENGAGKSTTMRMIACRSPLSDGDLFVEDFSVKSYERSIRSLIGIVPQENNLDPDLNVLENLIVYSRYFRIPIIDARKRSAELLDFIRLGNKSTAKVEQLSGGMKRRLIIARALLHRPKILLLDEPTTGLDPNVRQEIWDKLEELRRTEQITIVLSTHYMDEAEKLAQRLFVMANGKIIAQGNTRRIINENVKKFALEIREVDSIDPLRKTDNRIISQKRGSSHIYFADTADELTFLMNSYIPHTKILRPSNLEDVFLTLTHN